jgi:lysophospholipase L1-like esterase
MPILGRGRPHGPARVVPAPLISSNPGALTQWAAALTGLNSVPARWLAIGDGPTEGQGSSTRAGRWVDQVLSTIRTAKSVTGTQQFISAAYGVTGTDSPWANTGVVFAGSVSAAATSGVGSRIAVLSQGGTAAGQFGTSTFGTAPFGGTAGGSTAGSVTFTVTGTTVDLWYVSELSSGSFTYQVDSGTAVSVSTAATHDIKRITGISLGANTSHTVTVTVTAGTVYLSGLTVYGTDGGTGVHLYEAARTAATTATFAANTTDLADVAATVAPDLVTIQLGYNDVAAGIGPGTHRSNLLTIISTLRALPKVPSIALIIGHYPASLGSATSTTGILPRSGWTATADTQETTAENGAASNVLDGNPSSIWHTQYSGVVSTLPHNIVIDMRSTSIVSQLRYLPRPASGSANGTIGAYQVHVSTDGTTWGSPVASGTWIDDATEKTASFTGVSARYIRLTATTEAGGRGPWTSAAEINVVGLIPVTTGGWPDYVSVQRSLGVIDSNLGVVDLSLQLPLADTAGTGLYRTDGRHPNDSGHTAWATRIAAFTNVAVTPPVASPAAGRHFLMAVA